MAMTRTAGASGELDHFLGRVHTDNELQRLLSLPDARAAALAVARAAGYSVDLADLLAPAQRSGTPSAATATADGESIDFDGDGIADAVRQGGRWVLTSQDD
jgi:hypothetical protein